MSTARIKQDIETYCEALEAVEHGEYHVAERALGLSGLNLIQIRHGCVQRLKAAYYAAVGYGSRKRIVRDLLVKAHKLLTANGISDVPTPPDGKKASASVKAFVERMRTV